MKTREGRSHADRFEPRRRASLARRGGARRGRTGRGGGAGRCAARRTVLFLFRGRIPAYSRRSRHLPSVAYRAMNSRNFSSALYLCEMEFFTAFSISAYVCSNPSG